MSTHVRLAGLAAAVVLIATALPSTATAATSPAQAGLANLASAYTNYLFGTDWWQAAVTQSTVLTYEQATGDTSYYADIAATYANAKDPVGKPDFENDELDDTAWWALAWLQAYDQTGDTAYLQTAENAAAYIHGYWDSTCDGGVWWDIGKTYKNAITNELFLELTAWLHNDIPGDTTYLGWANAEWSWFSASGMINSSDLVNDGLTSGCANNGGTTWTYNQGVILAALAQLYQATGNASLLTTAEGIATAAISHLAPGGVLTEPCASSGCDGDQEIFKGIFVRDLATLAATANTSMFDSFIDEQATSIETTYPGNGFGLLWSGTPESTCTSTTANPCTTATEASAEQALVAALATTVTGAELHYDDVQSACPTTSNYDSTSESPYLLGVGYDGFSTDLCAPGMDYAYYVVTVPSAIWGQPIESAFIDAQEVYSASCSVTAPVTLSWTGGLSSSADWDNMADDLQDVDTVSVSPDPQSCGTAADSSAPLAAGFNVTSIITKAAAEKWTNFTFRLWQQGSPSDTAFKQFGSNPELVVTYG
jgi:predicted alpha-1,6-mannanase (GH76 family)